MKRAAYRHATQMTMAEGEHTPDYGGKADELKHSQIMLPGDAPTWAVRAYGAEAFQAALDEILAHAAQGRLLLGSNETVALHDVAEAGLLPTEVAERMAWARVSQRLWNDIERVETTTNKFPDRAMLARELTISLPRALSREAQIDLMRGYIREAYTSRGTVVDWVLHDKGDGKPHAHLMLPTRFLDVDAWGGKDRRLTRGRAVTEVRRTWERHANMILEREGLRDRVDMRSLKDRGIMLEPESYSVRIAEHAETAGATPTEKLNAEKHRKRNQEYLREHPEHILTVVQSRLATFTEAELLAELADRLDETPETLPAELAAAVSRSADLVPTAARTAEGERLFITRAKAEQGARLAADSARLVAARMAPELVSAGDAFESGSGAILVDVGPVVAAREEEERAADAKARREREPAPARASRPQISVDAVREALRARADDLFRDAFGPPVRPNAPEWRAKANEGVAMQMRGEKRGLWRDHSAGEGGDLLDLAARVLCGLDSAKRDFPRALREAAGWAGVAPDHAPDPDRVAARRRERERAVAAEEKRDAERRAALVREIAARAVPVAGTPAALYLASRGIGAVPQEGLAYLPPVPGLAVRNPDAASLVVWARDADGVIQGGQRILIDTDGAPLDMEVRKPAFGAISGVPARFPARDGELAKGPLVIAEGPESALAAWEATGLETWAVFGVSGFAAAPVPEDREVILAPDRDAPESPAGRAFRQAVAEHLERGRNLGIAMAPEPSGSKSDLNDTLQRAGLAEVRAAIEAARPVRAWLPAELNKGQREAAEAMLGPDRLTLVKGHAGTGKTHTLRAVAAIWQERGVEVFAGAPSGKATQELARLDGARAATLSAWESRWERGDVPNGPFVFLMDEAGMVGVEQWARVQSRVLAAGGKLVAIGDPEQLRPVGDLSGWASAASTVHTLPVIDQVLRQRDDGARAAVTALARGRNGIQAGIDHFLAIGAVRLEPEVLADPVAALATAYWEGPEDASRIALAYSNRDVDRLNEALRAAAVSKGIVNDAAAIEVAIARERRVRIAGGGARVWRQDARIRIGAGDRVLLTRPAPELGLPRSGFGTVTKAADGRITVLVDGREQPVEIDPAAFPHLDHGFAATIHKAQGMTADQVSVLPHARMDGQATYVALSRHRDRVTVFGRRRHLESAEDLHRMGVRVAAPPVPKIGKGRAAIQMPENATTDRPDWQGSRRSASGGPIPGLAGDAHLQSVALRTAGLLSADRAEGDPVLRAVPDGRDDFSGAPQDAIDTLVARHGVIRAEELAAALSAPLADPETFLRLFDEAIRHPDLVALPGGAASREGDAWVYTSTGHLRAELAAVDRAMRMAARSGETDAAAAPEPTEPLSSSQREALVRAMRAGAEGGGLALVTGGPASGKTRLAAEIARAHAAQGRVVTVVAATAAGRSALEARGAWALTLEQFLAEQPAPRGEGDPDHVIVLDDAHSFGAFQADAALARAEATGGGVVAILDPARRPQLGGAVFRALADRAGAAALEGVQGVEGPLAGTLAGLAAGGDGRGGGAGRPPRTGRRHGGGRPRDRDRAHRRGLRGGCGRRPDRAGLVKGRRRRGDRRDPRGTRQDDAGTPGGAAGALRAARGSQAWRQAAFQRRRLVRNPHRKPPGHDPARRPRRGARDAARRRAPDARHRARRRARDRRRPGRDASGLVIRLRVHRRGGGRVAARQRPPPRLAGPRPRDAGGRGGDRARGAAHHASRGGRADGRNPRQDRGPRAPCPQRGGPRLRPGAGGPGGSGQRGPGARAAGCARGRSPGLRHDRHARGAARRGARQAGQRRIPEGAARARPRDHPGGSTGVHGNRRAPGPARAARRLDAGRGARGAGRPRHEIRTPGDARRGGAGRRSPIRHHGPGRDDAQGARDRAHVGGRTVRPRHHARRAGRHVRRPEPRPGAGGRGDARSRTADARPGPCRHRQDPHPQGRRRRLAGAWRRGPGRRAVRQGHRRAQGDRRRRGRHPGKLGGPLAEGRRAGGRAGSCLSWTRPAWSGQGHGRGSRSGCAPWAASSSRSGIRTSCSPSPTCRDGPSRSAPLATATSRSSTPSCARRIRSTRRRPDASRLAARTWSMPSGITWIVAPSISRATSGPTPSPPRPGLTRRTWRRTRTARAWRSPTRTRTSAR